MRSISNKEQQRLLTMTTSQGVKGEKQELAGGEMGTANLFFQKFPFLCMPLSLPDSIVRSRLF